MKTQESQKAAKEVESQAETQNPEAEEGKMQGGGIDDLPALREHVEKTTSELTPEEKETFAIWLRVHADCMTKQSKEQLTQENEAEGANVKSGGTVSESSAEDVEFPSTGIPRLDTFIGEAMDDACVIAYVCLELSRQNKELGDKIYAALGELAKPFRQGRFEKAHDLELEIYPMTKWLSLLDGYEAGLVSVQDKRGESDAVKTPCAPNKLLDLVERITDDAAAACLVCLDLQKANSQLAGEIRDKLWERARPIIEEGQIPPGMDPDVAADMMRLLGIRDAVLALSN